MGQAKPHGVQEIAVDGNCLLQCRLLLESSGRSFKQRKNFVWRAIEGVTDNRMSDGRKSERESDGFVQSRSQPRPK